MFGRCRLTVEVVATSALVAMIVLVAVASSGHNV